MRHLGFGFGLLVFEFFVEVALEFVLPEFEVGAAELGPHPFLGFGKGFLQVFESGLGFLDHGAQLGEGVEALEGAGAALGVNRIETGNHGRLPQGVQDDEAGEPDGIADEFVEGAGGEDADEAYVNHRHRWRVWRASFA